jgi:hypothetical protein
MDVTVEVEDSQPSVHMISLPLATYEQLLTKLNNTTSLPKKSVSNKDFQNAGVGGAPKLNNKGKY